MTDAAKTTLLTEVRTVIIPTRDQDRALEYYVGSLGFEKRLDVLFGEGDRWIEVAPPGAATSIALAPWHEGLSTGIQVSLNTSDADAVHAELLALGVDVDGAVMRMGDAVPPMFTFRDSEGNNFRVVERG